MQIHELNTKALTDPAYVAFDDGTDTYKADFKEVIDDAVAEAFSSADVSGGVVNYTSGDSESPTAWTNVSVMTSGGTLATLMNRISTMVKNVRYIWNKIGTTSMGTTATTITGAIAEHENDISTLNGKTQAGYGAIENATTTEKIVQITFPRAFSYAPRVVVSLYNSSYNRRIHVTSITETGFVVVGALLSGSSSAAIEFEWVAIMP